MNVKTLFAPLLAAATLAAPATLVARDHHEHHGDWHHSDWHHGGYYSHHYYGSGYRPYYDYYGYPALGFSIYSHPDYYSPRVYRGYESSDSLAVDVQRGLRRRGYYRGPINGEIGSGSRAAIRTYQHDRGLAVTGRIDGALLRALDIR